jgi:hypothetical protein
MTPRLSAVSAMKLMAAAPGYPGVEVRPLGPEVLTRLIHEHSRDSLADVV